MAYPIISEYIKSKTQTQVISSYEQTIKDLSEEELNRLKKEAEDYNNRLSGNTESINDSDVKSYIDLLNVGDIIGYIEIPKIKVELPIYHGTDDLVLQKGIGHLESSSLPVGGPNTHAILTGHRGLPTSTLFTHLDKVEEGDIFYIKVLNDILAYKVDQIKVVEPTEVSYLAIIDGEDYVTLITCTPYMINSHRLLVRGVRTDAEYINNDPAEQKNLTENTDIISIRENTNQFIIIYFAAICFLVSFLYIFWYSVNMIKMVRKAKAEKDGKENEVMLENSVPIVVDEENEQEIESFENDIDNPISIDTYQSNNELNNVPNEEVSEELCSSESTDTTDETIEETFTDTEIAAIETPVIDIPSNINEVNIISENVANDEVLVVHMDNEVKIPVEEDNMIDNDIAPVSIDESNEQAANTEEIEPIIPEIILSSETKNIDESHDDVTEEINISHVETSKEPELKVTVEKVYPPEKTFLDILKENKKLIIGTAIVSSIIVGIGCIIRKKHKK